MARVFNKDSLYRLPGDKQILLVGSSHVACDINDTLLANTLNLSKPGDVVANSYEKLKKILPLNPQIRLVLLGCSEGDISKRITEDEDFHKSISYHIDNYFFLMTPGEVCYLLENNPKDAMKALVSLPRSRSLLCLRVIRSQATLKDLNIGKYEYIGGTINFKKEQEKFAKNNYDVSAVAGRQVDYLHKIVALCRERNVKLIIIRMPEHKIFTRKNEKIFLDILHQQFAEVPFKDYADTNIPDSCFEDHDHLNGYGAVIITDSLKDYLHTLGAQ